MMAIYFYLRRHMLSATYASMRELLMWGFWQLIDADITLITTLMLFR